MSQVAYVLRYDDHDTAVAALSALGFDMSNDIQPDGYCIGTDGQSHYFNMDVYTAGTGILFDENGVLIPGFFFGVLWQGEASTCPDFGSAICDPPPYGAPVWGR